MGIGGLLERETMERVRDRLLDRGADKEADNATLLTEIFVKWLN